MRIGYEVKKKRQKKKQTKLYQKRRPNYKIHKGGQTAMKT